MELRVLNYFLTVVYEENITSAAEKLHITQPTLSRQLMQLEEELGVSLFRRGKKKITLTSEGLLLKRRAEEILDLTNRTEQELKEQQPLMNGEIAIGGGETQSMRVLADFIKVFSSEYPQVTYKLYSADADDIKDRVNKGLMDICLLTEPVDIDKYDFIRIPQKEYWGVVMRKDSPLAQKRSVAPEDLLPFPILIPGRALVQNELDNWFGDSYGALHIIGRYNLIYNAAIMVEAGIGVALCLEKLVPASEETELCFRPLAPALETGVVIAWKKYQVFPPAVAKFIELLKNALKA
ncbi:LysR family transcriptional regulator [Trichococcus ilyis]|jgi:DNA-binding transcriptional LysR family regulator|uniref:DNA-binding transcriptional regulator, LysR family n=1 Tax=Trichococcus ilyis TaxID=640938 RepID=A0A143YMB6_9LACT|nr:LysR family transcriptional regulator [Trichococcus ilyis]CZQ92922.1 transcription regulator hth lysr [Trichococcus ilyis]SEI93251.1 DNA-binding transcriptional regulator, LysR family [Trichococcus ilyis]